jgi:hypothetical protein
VLASCGMYDTLTCAVCDTPQGRKSPQLLPLSRSRYAEYVRRGRYSVSTVVGREKRRNNTSIQVCCLLSGAMLVGAPMPF